MEDQQVLQLSFFVVVDDDEDQAARIEVTGRGPLQEASSVVDLEGLSLVELSLALQSALAVVQDLMNWERVQALAEKEMRSAESLSAFPF